MTTAEVFAEVLEGYTNRLGEPQREHNLARWKRPDGDLCLIEWPVYGFVELAAITEGAQQPWFLSEPGAAFTARFGVHPIVDAGAAVVQACGWLEERAEEARKAAVLAALAAEQEAIDAGAAEKARHREHVQTWRRKRE